jgi:hypothetical protein
MGRAPSLIFLKIFSLNLFYMSFLKQFLSLYFTYLGFFFLFNLFSNNNYFLIILDVFNF